VALLIFKVRSTSTPSYLRLLIQDREHGRNLRSALCQPFTTTTFAKRAFRCTAPAVWNSLPQTVLNSDSVAVVKSRVKTFLLSQAFSSYSAHYNTLPGPSASEVTTLWRYTNLFYYHYLPRQVDKQNSSTVELVDHADAEWLDAHSLLHVGQP